MRLLNLPEDNLQKIESEELKFSHFLEILRFGENEQKIVANSTISKKLLVMDLREFKNILNVMDNAATTDKTDTCSDDDNITFYGNLKQKENKGDGLEKGSETIHNGLFFGVTKAHWIAVVKNFSFSKKVQIALDFSA
jgi:hypothetical protein